MMDHNGQPLTTKTAFQKTWPNSNVTLWHHRHSQSSNHIFSSKNLAIAFFESALIFTVGSWIEVQMGSVSRLELLMVNVIICKLMISTVVSHDSIRKFALSRAPMKTIANLFSVRQVRQVHVINVQISNRPIAVNNV